MVFWPEREFQNRNFKQKTDGQLHIFPFKTSIPIPIFLMSAQGARAAG